MESNLNIKKKEILELNSKTEKRSKINSFKCQEIGCNKTYSGVSGLNNHLKKKHSKSLEYSCDECILKFKSQHERTLHKIKEHEGRRYQSKFSKTIKEVNENIAKLSNTIKYNNTTDTEICEFPCPECSKVFFTHDMFNEHRSLHDETIPKHTCIDCGKEFISERKLKEHSIVHQERIMYKCNVCAKVFLRSQTLQYHRLICKAAYPCDQCVDSFMTEESLSKHKLFHSIENFTCQKCNKVFPNEQTLANHEKRHSLRMNYTCQICKETISTRAKFQKHLKNHLETNLICSICKEKFQSLVKYGYHKAEMHSIMRPYDCILCNDEFCTRHELFVHLHNHIDTNTSTNTYICEKCSSKFSLKEHFEQHKKSHLKNLENESELTNDDDNIDNDLSVESPKDMLSNEVECNKKIEELLNYKCDLCNKNFEYKTLLSHHKLTEHEIKKYPCTIGFCDQIFDSADDLKRHAIQHEQLNKSLEKVLFQCNVEGCERSFQYPGRLRKHMSSHALTELKCSKCLRIYYSEAVYQKHLIDCNIINNDINELKDLNSGPVECQTCRQLFENKNVLKCHRKFCWGATNCEVESQVDETESQDVLENICSPASILSVYVQNDYDSNLLSEL